MKHKARYPGDWELLTATSSIALAGRLKILWEYVICGRKPLFTIECWVHPQGSGIGKIGELKLYVNYKE